MYGLIFDCLEKYVSATYGKEFWKSILRLFDDGRASEGNASCPPSSSTTAGSCPVAGESRFYVDQNYSDNDFHRLIDLVREHVGGEATAKITVEAFLENVGAFFIDYVSNKDGYDKLLRCQGDCLREWIGRVQDIHSHLQATNLTDEGAGVFQFPEIFCVDNEYGNDCGGKQEEESSYHSSHPENINNASSSSAPRQQSSTRGSENISMGPTGGGMRSTKSSFLLPPGQPSFLHRHTSSSSWRRGAGARSNSTVNRRANSSTAFLDTPSANHGGYSPARDVIWGDDDDEISDLDDHTDNGAGASGGQCSRPPSLLVYYRSVRGSSLISFLVGIIRRAADLYFGIALGKIDIVKVAEGGRGSCSRSQSKRGARTPGRRSPNPVVGGTTSPAAISMGRQISDRTVVSSLMQQEEGSASPIATVTRGNSQVVPLANEGDPNNGGSSTTGGGGDRQQQQCGYTLEDFFVLRVTALPTDSPAKWHLFSTTWKRSSFPSFVASVSPSLHASTSSTKTGGGNVGAATAQSTAAASSLLPPRSSTSSRIGSPQKMILAGAAAAVAVGGGDSSTMGAGIAPSKEEDGRSKRPNSQMDKESNSKQQHKQSSAAVPVAAAGGDDPRGSVASNLSRSAAIIAAGKQEKEEGAASSSSMQSLKDDIDKHQEFCSSGGAAGIAAAESKMEDGGNNASSPAMTTAAAAVSSSSSSSSLPAMDMRKLSPYHVMISKNNMRIVQLGERIESLVPKLMRKLGCLASDWLRIVSPGICQQWDLDALMACKDAVFELEVLNGKGEAYGRSSSADGQFSVLFHLTGRMHVADGDAAADAVPGGQQSVLVFLVDPHVNSLDEMSEYNLSWSSFGKLSSMQKVIMLQEQLYSETWMASKSKKVALRSQRNLEMKRMFVRYVSHEIRTPLNTVMMGLDLMRDNLATLKRQEEESQQRMHAATNVRTIMEGEDEEEQDRDDFSDDERVRDDREEQTSPVATTQFDSGVVDDLMNMADDVKESSVLAVGILNDLLLYEKLEGGILALEKTCEPALALVYDAVRTFSIQARRAQLSLDFCFNQDVFPQEEFDIPSIFADVDKAKISQVIRNMVSNAIKFSDCSGKVDENNQSTVYGRVLVNISIVEGPQLVERMYSTVSLSQSTYSTSPINLNNNPHHSPVPSMDASLSAAFASSRAQKYIRVEVVDFGPGLSPENQAKLFGSIIQFDANKLQSGGGSGLGLYISKGIMDLHGGTIGVFSEGEGKGSSFTIDFPVHYKSERCTFSGSLHGSPQGSYSNAEITKSSSRNAGVELRKRSASPVDGRPLDINNKEQTNTGPLMPTVDELSEHDNSNHDTPLFNSGSGGSSARTGILAAGGGGGGPTSSTPHRKNKKVSSKPNGGKRKTKLRGIFAKDEFPDVSPAPSPVCSQNKSMFGKSPLKGIRSFAKSFSDSKLGSAQTEKNNSVNSIGDVLSSGEDPSSNSINTADYSRGGGVKTSAATPASGSGSPRAGDSGSARLKSPIGVTPFRVLSMGASTPSGRAFRGPGSDASPYLGNTKGSAGGSAGGSTGTGAVVSDSSYSGGGGGGGGSSGSSRDQRRHSSDSAFDTSAFVSNSGKDSMTKLRLLVVDDSVANRKMTIRFLKLSALCGEILEASDGSEALSIVTETLKHTSADAAAAVAIDGILMDSVMPVLDGPMATKLIRKAGYVGPIIGVTGNFMKDDVDFFLAQGATSVMCKPLDVIKLRVILEGHQKKKDVLAAAAAVAASQQQEQVDEGEGGPDHALSDNILTGAGTTGEAIPCNVDPFAGTTTASRHSPRMMMSPQGSASMRRTHTDNHESPSTRPAAAEKGNIKVSSRPAPVASGDCLYVEESKSLSQEKSSISSQVVSIGGGSPKRSTSHRMAATQLTSPNTGPEKLSFSPGSQEDGISLPFRGGGGNGGVSDTDTEASPQGGSMSGRVPPSHMLDMLGIRLPSSKNASPKASMRKAASARAPQWVSYRTAMEAGVRAQSVLSFDQGITGEPTSTGSGYVPGGDSMQSYDQGNTTGEPPSAGSGYVPGGDSGSEKSLSTLSSSQKKATGATLSALLRGTTGGAVGRSSSVAPVEDESLARKLLSTHGAQDEYKQRWSNIASVSNAAAAAPPRRKSRNVETGGVVGGGGGGGGGMFNGNGSGGGLFNTNRGIGGGSSVDNLSAISGTSIQSRDENRGDHGGGPIRPSSSGEFGGPFALAGVPAYPSMDSLLDPENDDMFSSDDGGASRRSRARKGSNHSNVIINSNNQQQQQSRKVSPRDGGKGGSNGTAGSGGSRKGSRPHIRQIVPEPVLSAVSSNASLHSGFSFFGAGMGGSRRSLSAVPSNGSLHSVGGLNIFGGLGGGGGGGGGGAGGSGSRGEFSSTANGNGTSSVSSLSRWFTGTIGRVFNPSNK